MKVLLLNGSPRRAGCTNQALEIAAKILNGEGIETEIFWIGASPVAGCIGCGKCRENQRCVFRDKVNEFIEKAEAADGFIFGAPVHYASPAGAAIAFLDRAFSGKHSVYRWKPGAAIVSCRRGGATFSFDVLNKYFTIAEMPVVSSNYWNMVHGNTPQEVLEDKEGVQTVEILAKNMAYLLKCLELAKKNGLAVPTVATKIKTDFIR